MANNRKCAICGKMYSYCPGCGEDKDKPAWMTTFDSNNCRMIYKITSNYIGKAITIDQAREQLKEYDLTRTDKYNEVIAGRIDEIMKIENPKFTKKKKKTAYSEQTE